jgi:hypothetical protein
VHRSTLALPGRRAARSLRCCSRSKAELEPDRDRSEQLACNAGRELPPWVLPNINYAAGKYFVEFGR